MNTRIARSLSYFNLLIICGITLIYPPLVSADIKPKLYQNYLQQIYVALRLGDFYQANLVLQKLIPLADQDQLIQLGRLQTATFLCSGRLEQAHKMSNNLLQGNPQDPILLLTAAYTDFKQAKWNDLFLLQNDTRSQFTSPGLPYVIMTTLQFRARDIQQPDLPLPQAFLKARQQILDAWIAPEADSPPFLSAWAGDLFSYWPLREIDYLSSPALTPQLRKKFQTAFHQDLTFLNRAAQETGELTWIFYQQYLNLKLIKKLRSQGALTDCRKLQNATYSALQHLYSSLSTKTGPYAGYLPHLQGLYHVDQALSLLYNNRELTSTELSRTHIFQNTQGHPQLTTDKTTISLIKAHLLDALVAFESSHRESDLAELQLLLARYSSSLQLPISPYSLIKEATETALIEGYPALLIRCRTLEAIYQNDSTLLNQAWQQAKIYPDRSTRFPTLRKAIQHLPQQQIDPTRNSIDN